jgi:hypothetical protein
MLIFPSGTTGDVRQGFLNINGSMKYIFIYDKNIRLLFFVVIIILQKRKSISMIRKEIKTHRDFCRLKEHGWINFWTAGGRTAFG